MTDFTETQMKLWHHIVGYVWARWVLPVAVVGFGAGVVCGFGLRMLVSP